MQHGHHDHTATQPDNSACNTMHGMMTVPATCVVQRSGRLSIQKLIIVTTIWVLVLFCYMLLVWEIQLVFCFLSISWCPHDAKSCSPQFPWEHRNLTEPHYWRKSLYQGCPKKVHITIYLSLINIEVHHWDRPQASLVGHPCVLK